MRHALLAFAACLVLGAATTASAAPGHPIMTRVGHGASRGLHSLGHGLHSLGRDLSHATHPNHRRHHRR